MLNSWLAIINNLPLSRTEREVVRRFEQDPAGRSFLPLADILRAHKLVDESLELLSQGVAAHPGFTVARVVLARELLQKGLIEQAWRTLEESTVSLKDNLLAQKLRFKLALLQGREDLARESCAQLEQQQMLDAETRRLAEILKGYGAAQARQKLIDEFEERGTQLSLSPPAQAASSSRDGGVGAAASRGAQRSSGDDTWPGRGRDVPNEALPTSRSDAAFAEGQDPAPGVAAGHGASTSFGDGGPWDDALAGFHVVPLAEIFRPDGSGDPAFGVRDDGNAIELDSTTLADIYARQGHYSKALAVYRRLLQMAPGNELLRRKVAELLQLEKERQDVELTVDPTLVDRLETVEIIDRQIRFLSDLLAKLT